MRLPRVLATVAAFALTLVSIGTAFATPVGDSEDFNLIVTAGTELSVEITLSGDFDAVPFSLAGPANYTDSAYFNSVVVDMRGTGAGWNVTASASPFTPAIPGATLHMSNNTLWSGLCTPAASFCASPGSISNGISHYSGGPNIMGTSVTMIGSIAGTTSAPAPYGTGTFGMQTAIYYNNIPDALAVGTYETTVTLSIAGLAP
jgi:hypothetical protein